MNQAMKKAKETFAQGNYTCVWCRDDELLTSKEAGLRPLLTRIREGKDLNGFYAADKIVGRAAAFLYVKLGAAGVYAPVMSRGAKELLAEYNIPAEADELTENIRNRQNTGLCPMECVVSSCGSPEAAYVAILEAIRKMQQK